jgi:hypothetical protein
VAVPQSRRSHPELPRRGEHRALDTAILPDIREPDAVFNAIVRAVRQAISPQPGPRAVDSIGAHIVVVRLAVPFRRVKRLAIGSRSDPLAVA